MLEEPKDHAHVRNVMRDLDEALLKNSGSPEYVVMTALSLVVTNFIRSTEKYDLESFIYQLKFAKSLTEV